MAKSCHLESNMRWLPRLYLLTRAIAVMSQSKTPDDETDLGLINAMTDDLDALGWWDHGYGEPLNAIISNHSHPSILRDLSGWGKPSFNHYFLAHYLSDECLGQKGPGKMVADLNDGRGMVKERGLKRWTFRDDYLGTCIQTFDGGLHFRYFVQNITDLDLTTTGQPSSSSPSSFKTPGGAIFLAVSEEHDLTRKHDIVLDGYNLGRDYLIGNLTGQSIQTKMDSEKGGRVTAITDRVEYQAKKTFEGIRYETSVRYHTGLARNTSEKINHKDKVTIEGVPAVDGWVAVITVTIDETGSAEGAKVVMRGSMVWWTFAMVFFCLLHSLMYI